MYGLDTLHNKNSYTDITVQILMCLYNSSDMYQLTLVMDN